MQQNFRLCGRDKLNIPCAVVSTLEMPSEIAVDFSRKYSAVVSRFYYGIECTRKFSSARPYQIPRRFVSGSELHGQTGRSDANRVLV